MKRPSFQFYPADCLANANLKRCSWEAKGAWLMLMCLLHDSDEYGVLRWPMDEIALAVGCDIKLIQELVKKGVLKGIPKGGIGGGLIYTPRSGGKSGESIILLQEQCGDGDDIWYSSRMVIDEHVRQKRAAYGDLAQKNPNASRKNEASPKGGIDTPLDTPPSSSSSSSSINLTPNPPIHPPQKTEKPKKKKESPKVIDAKKIELPDLIKPHKQWWDKWIDARAIRGVPDSESAIQLSIERIERLNSEGYSVDKVLKMAVEKTWAGLNHVEDELKKQNTKMNNYSNLGNYYDRQDARTRAILTPSSGANFDSGEIYDSTATVSVD